MAIIEKLEKWAKLVSKWIAWVGGAGVVVMLGLTIADIIGIKILSTPVPGGIEIVAFLGVVTTAVGMAFTQAEHGIFQVSLCYRLPVRIRAILVSLHPFWFYPFCLLAWQA
jgi:TRAP-type C4-dicarboxylate transport system permease small subunit